MPRYAGVPTCDTPNALGEFYPDILQIEVPALFYDYEIVTLNKAYANRFDLFVKNYYGNADMDWAVLWNNQLACSFDLYEGITLLVGK